MRVSSKRNSGYPEYSDWLNQINQWLKLNSDGLAVQSPHLSWIKWPKAYAHHKELQTPIEIIGSYILKSMSDVPR